MTPGPRTFTVSWNAVLHTLSASDAHDLGQQLATLGIEPAVADAAARAVWAFSQVSDNGLSITEVEA